MAHEILNASPYAFLDDAPLEERRARAVSLRRTDASVATGIGALDADAVAEVQAQAWPDVRDADELHDAMLDLVWLPSDAGAVKPDPRIFTSALAELGVPPERALAVGNDPERDLAGARAAGVRAVDVASLATLADLPSLCERELPEEPTR